MKMSENTVAGNAAEIQDSILVVTRNKKVFA